MMKMKKTKILRKSVRPFLLDSRVSEMVIVDDGKIHVGTIECRNPHIEEMSILTTFEYCGGEPIESNRDRAIRYANCYMNGCESMIERIVDLGGFFAVEPRDTFYVYIRAKGDVAEGARRGFNHYS